MSTICPVQNNHVARGRPKAPFSLMSLGFAGVFALGGCGGGETSELEPWSATIERAAVQAAANPAVSGAEANAKGAAPVIASPKRIDAAPVMSGAAVAQAATSSCYPPLQYETVYLYEVDVVNGAIPANGIKTLTSYSQPILAPISAPVPGAATYCGATSYYEALVNYQQEVNTRTLLWSYSEQTGWTMMKSAEIMMEHVWSACTPRFTPACAGIAFGSSVQVFIGRGTSLQEMVNNGRYLMVLNFTVLPPENPFRS